MSDDIVQLVTFSNKWVSVFQYFCLDLVDNIMLLFDSTWPKVMMLYGFVRWQVKLTLELLCNTGEFWGGKEERLSSIGVVRDADESRMNFHQLVQMLACVACPYGYKGNVTLRDCNVACLQLFPGFGVIGPPIIHVGDVSGPESLIFNPVKGEEELAQLLSCFEMKLQVSIPGCSDKQQDCFYSMYVIHHCLEHCILGSLFLPFLENCDEISSGQRLK